MVKKKTAKSETKNIKTEELEEIIKRKELQNKMFEKMIFNIEKPNKSQTK